MKLSSVIKVLVLILVVVFVGHQLISSVYTPIGTESAEYYTAVDGIKVNGIIIRNEALVTSDNSGIMHFLISDGERVSKNGVIANIYENESASITVSRLEALKEKIDDIEDILSYNDVEAINLDVINAKVDTRVNELIMSASCGNYSSVTASSDYLLSALNRKQAALGTAGDFSAQLDALKNEYNSLSASLPAARASIYANASGYFVSKTDGYETVINTADLNALTPEFVNSVKPVSNGASVIGKIVADYEWYIAAQVSVNDSLKFKEGEELTLQTPIKSASTLPVTVKKINTSNDNKTAVILFFCNQMNSELASMRSLNMTVVKDEYEGLRVSRKALRVVDSQKGVYVVSGMQLNFVPVDIIYYGDDFILCRKNNDDGNELKLYDKVVVKGKKLYDGKIIK